MCAVIANTVTPEMTNDQLIALKETILRKDLDIATLKGELATATKVAAKDSKLIQVYRKQTGDAKKMNKHVSVDDQIRLDNTKRERTK